MQWPMFTGANLEVDRQIELVKMQPFDFSVLVASQGQLSSMWQELG